MTDRITTESTAQALAWVASLGAAPADAVAQHLGVSPARALARLNRARSAGLLSRCRPLEGKPALYSLTRRGLAHADAAAGGICRVRASNAAHLIACARVAAAMERRHPDHTVEGERGLRRAEHAAGRPLASAVVAQAAAEPRLHRPDLILWPRPQRDELPVAVEVELTLKAPRRLAGICRAWARCRLVGGVLYCAPPEVARAVQRAIREAGAEERIVVLDFAATLSPDRTVPSWA